MMDSEQIVEFIENHRDLIKSDNFQKKILPLIQEAKENEEENPDLEENYEIKNKLPFEDDYAKGHYDVWLMPWIRDRIARNQNVLGLFIGPTGSGKSYSAMELARSVDSTFMPNKSVFLSWLSYGAYSLCFGLVSINRAFIPLLLRIWTSSAASSLDTP